MGSGSTPPYLDIRILNQFSLSCNGETFHELLCGVKFVRYNHKGICLWFYLYLDYMALLLFVTKTYITHIGLTWRGLV